MWSVGWGLSLHAGENGREAIGKALAEYFKSDVLKAQLPQGNIVLVLEVPKAQYRVDKNFSQVFLPSTQSACALHFARLAFKHDYPQE
jgi:hypothetical protein